MRKCTWSASWFRAAAFGMDAFHGVRQFTPVLCAWAVSFAVMATVFLMCQRDEILGPVVVSNAVDMVPVFVWPQRPTKFLFEHDAMFEHVTLESVGSGCWMVRLVDVDVAANCPPAGKVPVIRAKPLDAMAMNEWAWIAIKQPLSRMGLVGNIGWLSAAAFARARRDLVLTRNQLPHGDHDTTIGAL